MGYQKVSVRQPCLNEFKVLDRWGRPVTGAAFLSTIAESGYRYYLAVRENTFLDRLYAKLFKKTRGKLFFGENPFGKRLQEKYLVVIDNYVASLSIGENLQQALTKLYSSVSSPSEVQLGSIQEIFEQEGSVRLSLENSAERANRLRKRFIETFNL